MKPIFLASFLLATSLLGQTPSAPHGRQSWCLCTAKVRRTIAFADGKLTLIAVEYITHKGPASLEGHLFNFTGAPNRYGLPPFYELHAWIWKHNPRGTFDDWNPRVHCPAA